MDELLLTLDLGNSGCKACAWRDGRVQSSARWPVAPESGEALLHWMRGLSTTAGFRAALSSVAAETVTERLRATLEAALGPRFVGALATGVENATRTPDTVGHDRLFAARGAFELTGSSAIVVDVGTAMTVDAIEVDPRAARPRFLGGAIAPGPALLVEAMKLGTARLPRVELVPDTPALGRDTPQAIAAGIVHGLRGAVQRLARSIATEAGFERAPIVVTGGARGWLLGALAELEAGVREDEWLVQRGLCAALRDDPTAIATRRHPWE